MLIAKLAESEVSHGEYKVEFNGRDRTQAKRKALDYWYNNREFLKLTLRDFFLKCRASPDGLRITFFQGSTAP